MLSPSQRLDRGVVTRSIRVADHGRGIDILDERRRRIYSVRSNRDVAIASCHPCGVGGALALPKTSASAVIRFGEEVVVELSSEGALLTGPTSALRLVFEADRLTLILPDGFRLSRFVRNLQLKVVNDPTGVAHSNVCTPYNNPLDTTRASSGITMSTPVSFPLVAAMTGLVDFCRLAAVGAVAAQLAAAAFQGVRGASFDQDLAASLGDAAVIAAVLRSGAEMSTWLGGAEGAGGQGRRTE